jgi:hypothetical protein
MKLILFFFSSLILLTSCDSKDQKFKTVNPNSEYFYPIDSVPKIYLYRDIAHGLEEEFHRIYAISDFAGEHVVVERYASDGRILDALNYNVDSLTVFDQMVVDRFKKKEKARIYKNKLFPMDLKKESWFAVKFNGVVDSTMILREVKRNFKKRQTISVMEEEESEALVFEDLVRQTVLNPFTKKEQAYEAKQLTYFAKDYGLVEWHSLNKKVHYRLERILTQEEFVKIIAP